MVLFDLLGRINERNARVAALVDAGAPQERFTVEVEESLLTRVNRIFAKAHLTVELGITADASLDTRREPGEDRYPITQMSDGEKSALLLTAEMLLAPSDCVQVIDEPERHLHRSISAGLIDAIIAERPDCHFVVLTHDLELASLLASDSAQMVVASGVAWAGLAPSSWSLHSVGPEEDLPAGVRSAILGGKRKLIFVEGDRHSLDSRLYALLFPDWSLHASGGCEQVIRAVVGLGASEALHWIESRGIVDRDGRDEDEVVALGVKGVLVLGVHEVESLYYLPAAIAAVAGLQAATLERDAEALFSEAVEAALKALRTTGTAERLASSVAAQVVARKAAACVPDAKALASGAETATFEIESPYGRIHSAYVQMSDAGDLEGLVAAYPVRETPMRPAVARALGFSDADKYEAAVRSRLRVDGELLSAVDEFVGRFD